MDEPAAEGPPPDLKPSMIIPVAFDSKEHQDYVEAAKERIDFAQSGKRERQEMGRRAYKHYRCYLDKLKHQFPTFIVEPEFFADETTLVAREMQALMQSGRMWEYEADEDTDPEVAALATANVDRHLRMMRPRTEIKSALQARRFDGTSYVHYHWRTEERYTCRWVDAIETVQIGVDEMGQPITVDVPGQVWQEGREVVIDSPWFTFIPFDEAFPDWSASRLREGGFFCYKTYRDKKFVERMAGSGAWDRKAVARALDESEGTAFPMDRINSALEWQRQVGLGPDVQPSQIAGREWFEVIEMIEPDYITVILNQAFVVRRKRNPYGEINVLHLRNYHLPNEHFGMSDFEVVEKLLIGLQDMSNAGATEALLSVFTPVLARPGADVRSIVYKPMAIWKAQEGDITYLPRPANGVQVAEQQQGSRRAGIERGLGVSEAYRGSLPDGGAKATAISMAVQGAGLRLQDVIDDTNDSLVVPLGDAYHAMVSRWQSRDYVVRTKPGAPPQQTNIERIRTAKLKTLPTTSSAQILELQKKRLLELHALAVQTGEPSYNRREGFQRVAETVVPDAASRLVKSEAEMQQEAQQRQQMEASAMQSRQAVEQAQAAESQADAQRSQAQAFKAQVQAEDALSKTVNRAMGPKIEERVIEPPPDDVSELANLIGGAARL
jgi:hypothetical protein